MGGGGFIFVSSGLGGFIVRGGGWWVLGSGGFVLSDGGW